MARKHGGDGRKRFKFTADRAAVIERFASSTDMKATALIRSWIEGYLEHGTARPQPEPEYREFQVIIPPEIVAAAEKRARDEGIRGGLRGVIDLEIDALEEL